MSGLSNSKTVLITGASSGIGKTASLYMAGKGYSVIGTSRAIERLGNLHTEAIGRGLSIECVELDINNDESVNAEMPQLIEQYGTIDVLVNNAGYSLWGPLETLNLSQVKEQFESNLFGAIRMIQVVLPGMLEKGDGTIINISSILGRIGTPFNSAYAASKFALEGLSESLRIEMAPFGIKVCIVEPGLFDTAFPDNRVFGEKTEEKTDIYGPYVKRYWTKHRRYNHLSTDPTSVARAIDKIVRSRRPALRHPVGMETRIGSLGLRWLPESIFQSMLRRATMG